MEQKKATKNYPNKSCMFSEDVAMRLIYRTELVYGNRTWKYLKIFIG
jgi:hypothetical protein